MADLCIAYSCAKAVSVADVVVVDVVVVNVDCYVNVGVETLGTL